MNELIVQCGIMVVVLGAILLYTEWRIRGVSATIIKKIDAVMLKLIQSGK